MFFQTIILFWDNMKVGSKQNKNKSKQKIPPYLKNCKYKSSTGKIYYQQWYVNRKA